MKKIWKFLSVLLMAQMILTSSMNVFAANVKNQEQINNGVKVNLLNENCYIISAKGQMKRVTILRLPTPIRCVEP